MNIKYILGAILTFPLLPLMYYQGKKIKNKVPRLPEAKGVNGLCSVSSEKTFRISHTMRELKVMVTMLVNDSWKKITEPSMITQPWKMDFHVQIRNVLVESARPFCRPE
jgi:hypothetical protein